MFDWIPNLPSMDGKAAYETSKHVSGAVYNAAGQGLQAGWKISKDVASKPEVQKAAIVGAGVVGVVGAATAGLPLVGFTAAGVKGGTIAAAWQSSIGNVVAGSMFAKLTSAGAAGMAFTTKALFGTAGGYLSSKLYNPKDDK